MINKTFIPDYWGKALDQALGQELHLVVHIERDEVIAEIKEYQTLSRRRWKRRRDLEKSISRKMRHWIKDLEKLQAEKHTIQIAKIK